jgi:hypothetical protein
MCWTKRDALMLLQVRAQSWTAILWLDFGAGFQKIGLAILSGDGNGYPGNRNCFNHMFAGLRKQHRIAGHIRA